MFKPWLDLYIYSHLFSNLYSAVHMHQILFWGFHIIFIENKVWKQITLKHSTVSYHNKNSWLQDSTKSKNELCCRLPHAKIALCHLWKWKRVVFYGFLELWQFCVLQHNSWKREMCMDFMQKSTQISSDDMESFIFCNIDLVQMHREAFLKVSWLYKQLVISHTGKKRTKL